MAHLIQAILRYGPRLVLGPAVDPAVLARWLADGGGLDHAAVQAAIRDLHVAVEHFTGRGRPVIVPGIGCFRPTIDRDGRRRLVLVPAPELARSLDRPGRLAGEILNRDRAAWTDVDYQQAWDRDHPDDPLVLEEACGDGHAGDAAAGHQDADALPRSGAT